MTNTNDARRAHDVLDGLFAGRILSRENEQLLRSFLPELPKQKTLEELRREVYDVWAGTNGNEWPDDMYCDLENWLYKLHKQLRGLKDTPAAEPENVAATVHSLPAGMRLADHERHGRVVAAPVADGDGRHMIFCLDNTSTAEAGRRWVRASSLTFIDTERAKYAHPKFLETEADYQKAPEGTIVACEDSSPWYKSGPAWLSTAAYEGNNAKGMTGVIREVLRWSWANE